MQETKLVIKPAKKKDVPLILRFIKELAEYERLGYEVVATEELLRKNLFGKRKVAEVILGFFKDQPVSFALFFHNFSTFLGKPGIYIEDLYVKEEFRGRGFGTEMLSYLARLAKERDCGRLEWWVLDWNKSAIRFYEKIGAKPMSDWTVYRVTGDALDKLATRHSPPRSHFA